MHRERAIEVADYTIRVIYVIIPYSRNIIMKNQNSCPDGYFRCAYGGCVPESSRCNGQANCHDWSDEDEKTCGVSSLPSGACRLPAAAPGTHYAVKGDCERCRAGDAVPEFTRLDYSCHGNASQLEGPSGVHCQANRWLPSLPICLNGRYI